MSHLNIYIDLHAHTITHVIDIYERDETKYQIPEKEEVGGYL